MIFPPPYLDMEQPRCVDMLAPALRRQPRMPVVWDLNAGTLALVVLRDEWPADDEVRQAIALHRVLGRGVLAVV